MSRFAGRIILASQNKIGMTKTNFLSFQKRFIKIAGFFLPLRQPNTLQKQLIRVDNLFENLSRLYFDKPSKIKKLQKEIKNWQPEFFEKETFFSLSGYLYYLTEDFAQAKKFFLHALNLNPSNFDNWYDLAFALRHLGEERTSRGILFNFDHAIYYYSYFGFKNANYKKIKKMISAIQEKSDE